MFFTLITRYKDALSLIFTISFSLFCLIWQSNFFSIGLSKLSESLNVFALTFHSAEKKITEFFNSYIYYQNLKNERDVLKERLKKSIDMQWMLNKLENENEKLRNLLELQPHYEYKTLQAEIISKEPDNWLRTFIIDKGSQDNIEPYMPVLGRQLVNYNGKDEHPEKEIIYRKKIVHAAIGKVIQVNKTSARILPITNQYSQLGVKLKKSGQWGILKGQSPHQKMPLLQYINLSAPLNTNDEVVTSGNHGIFPKGIPVGRLFGKIERSSNFQEVKIKPFIDLQSLEYVIILLRKPNSSEREFQELNETD